MIAVEIDQAQLETVQQQLAHIKNGAARALSRALNKTASKAKTIASREIRKQVNLSAGYVRERLYGPSSGFEFKATINKLSAKLSAKKRGVLLREFATTEARLGRPPNPVRVRVKPGTPKIMPGAFWVPLKGGNGLSIAIRKGGRLDVLHGPSVSQVLTTVKDDISQDMSAVLAANLQHETGWLLQKYPPPGDDGSADLGD